MMCQSFGHYSYTILNKIFYLWTVTSFTFMDYTELGFENTVYIPFVDISPTPNISGRVANTIAH